MLCCAADEGIQFNHPDLAAHMWVNPGEMNAAASDGIDNDGNGKVDDVCKSLLHTAAGPAEHWECACSIQLQNFIQIVQKSPLTALGLWWGVDGISYGVFVHHDSGCRSNLKP